MRMQIGLWLHAGHSIDYVLGELSVSQLMAGAEVMREVEAERLRALLRPIAAALGCEFEDATVAAPSAGGKRARHLGAGWRKAKRAEEVEPSQREPAARRFVQALRVQGLPIEVSGESLPPVTQDMRSRSLLSELRAAGKLREG